MILRAGRRPDSLFVGQIRKTVSFAALLMAAALAFGVAPAAAKSCAQKVIDDWYDNGRVDAVYPIRCYREALKLLPDDVKSYSDAPDEINRALQDAIRQERDQINPPATPPETGGVAGTTSNPDDGEPAPGDTTSTTPDESAGSGGSSGDGGSSPPSSPASPPATPSSGNGDSNGLVGDAIKNLGPGSADSIPVPLIIVGALALLLLAAGSAGLVARRLQARRIRPDELDE